jgi:hypothetical protein
MRNRIAVTPVRVPEPLRSKSVAQFGEVAVAEFEAKETEWHDHLLNGDPNATDEPRGILHGSQLVARR